MHQILEGYRRFRTGTWRVGRELFEKLADGQNPHTMVIACSDSRVDPQLIFDAPPGEIFAIRNVANLIPPYAPNSDYHGTSAAVEFAVRGLGVKSIVVMGHDGCGGVRALLREGRTGTDFVDAWMSIASSAREKALTESGGDAAQAQLSCEYETVRVSLRNLMTFPYIRDAVEKGELELFGCHFGIATGDLMMVLPEGTEPAF